MCELCHKKCKSKSGLKRHKTVKHKETSEVAENQKGGGQESCLTLVAYSRIVEKAKHKIIDNKIYPKSIRDELSSYTYMKSGNAERFYSSFYSTIAVNAVKHFEGLSRNTATLLSTKVADCMLARSKEKTESMYTCAPLTKLSDEEIAGLQYIGGYVLHKLHTKHFSKSSESEQAISILKAGKLEDQNAIHRMQIWRTTRSSPGTSYMKARLVSLRCFVLKVLPQKSLALSSLCSVLFRCACEFLCF